MLRIQSKGENTSMKLSRRIRHTDWSFMGTGASVCLNLRSDSYQPEPEVPFVGVLIM